MVTNLIELLIEHAQKKNRPGKTPFYSNKQQLNCISCSTVCKLFFALNSLIFRSSTEEKETGNYRAFCFTTIVLPKVKNIVAAF